MKRRGRCENAFLIKTAAVLLAVAVLLSVVFYKMRPVILRHAESAAETLLLDASNKIF